ncbi:MAG: pyridoxamine 5'-phosphate oxidase family protein [Acidimicrobiia bacterium]
MLTWNEFAAVRPDLAEVGRARFYQVPVGLGFLATVRADGRPRVRPICPLLTPRGLFAFLIPSPKRADLLRDGHFELHSFPTDDNEDAFSVTGRAERRDDPDLREECAQTWFAERGLDGPSPPGFDEEQLFEFLVDGCLSTKTTGYGDYAPQHTVWKLGDS